ncbi:MAG: formate dehydrogenase subunit gamma [Burkholderiales bacterium]|nr:formate dehydrogenase subunit gamma [Burkholderiales bacterium]
MMEELRSAPSKPVPTVPAEIAAAVAAALAEHRQQPGALLPILHTLQASLGHVPDAAVALLADALNLSRAEVHGVITFYHHFRRTPSARVTVQVCRAEACQARGGDALAAHAERSLGCAFDRHDGGGDVALESIYCLGHCASGPSIAIGGQMHANVTPARFDALIESCNSAPAQRIDAGASSDGGAAAVASHGVVDSKQSTGMAAGGVTTVYVPCDSTALALGADAVAAAIAAEAQGRGVAIELVRNGSRGLFWLEPLVEVATPAGRIAYGPVVPEQVASLFEAGFLHGGAHPLSLGPTEAIPYLQRQQRLTFARIGIVDPRSLNDYLRHDGYAGLRRALAMTPAAIVDEVTASGLRGRGGAAFPTGIKWKTVLGAQSAQKYVVCNADEGDSGTFSDRMVMESDPFMLIEGMTIAGLAVGATYGYIYVRSEYPHAIATLNAAIEAARHAGYLGENLLGSGRRFDLEVRQAAGAYVCGEETALLESIEGKRGLVRAKPPLPAIAGLFGKPTVINNVISLATVPIVLARGAAFYADYGMGRSRGTLPIQLAGNIRYGGLVELAFGVTVRELLYDIGGGTASGRPIRAVQIGGPLGTYLPEAQFDVPLDYEALAAIGGVVGHGGLVVFDDTVDMARQARYAMQFCAAESCGKCTPCRIGSVRGVEVIDRIIAGHDVPGQQALLRDLCDTMLNGSLCAMGGMTPYPVLSALNHFPEDFGPAAPARQAA